MADFETFIPLGDDIPSAIIRAYSGAMRYGQPSNISYAFDDACKKKNLTGQPVNYDLPDEDEDECQKDDYVRGLVLSTLVVIIFFTVSYSCLLYFKIYGRKKRGFLTGKPFVLPPEGHPARDRLSNRHKSARQWFIICGLVYIAIAFLAMSLGTSKIQRGLDDLYAATTDIDTLLFEAQVIKNEGVAALIEIVSHLKRLSEDEMAEFCPAEPSLQNLPPEIQNPYEQANDTLTNFPEMDPGELEDLITQLPETEYRFTLAETFDVDLKSWEVSCILALFTYIPMLITCSALLVYFGVEIPRAHTAVVRFLMPAFIVLNLVGSILAALFLVFTGSTSDFCYPAQNEGVDASVRQIIVEEGYPPGSIVYKIADFYMQQCQVDLSENPFRILLEYLPEITEASERLGSFNSALTVDTSLYCEKDYEPLKAALSPLLEAIDIIIQSINAAFELTKCSIIVPLYYTALPEGTCEYLSKGLALMFFFVTVMGILGTIMVTLRSALSPSVTLLDNEELEDSKHENGSVIEDQEHSPVDE